MKLMNIIPIDTTTRQEAYIWNIQLQFRMPLFQIMRGTVRHITENQLTATPLVRSHEGQMKHLSDL